MSAPSATIALVKYCPSPILATQITKPINIKKNFAALTEIAYNNIKKGKSQKQALNQKNMSLKKELLITEVMLSGMTCNIELYDISSMRNSNSNASHVKASEVKALDDLSI